jgi:hypothetical protein
MPSLPPVTTATLFLKKSAVIGYKNNRINLPNENLLYGLTKSGKNVHAVQINSHAPGEFVLTDQHNLA